MKRADDIYHEDSVPSFARRGAHRSYRKKKVRSSAHHEAGIHMGGQSRSNRVFRGEHSAGNYSRKLIVALLCMVVLVYIAFLINSFRKGPENSSSGVSRAPETPPASRITDGPALEDIEELIAGNIQVDRDLLRVYTMLEAGNHKAAQEKLNQALQNRPENLDAKKAQAFIYAGQHRNEKAAVLLMDILRRDPGDEEARQALIRALAALGSYEAVLESADWYLRDQPYTIEVHYTAAQAALELGQVPKAIMHLKRIIEIDNRYRPARNLLGVAYRRQGAYDKAIEVFLEQLDYTDADSSAYYNLAICYAAQKQSEEAVACLQQAIDLFGASFIQAWLQSEHFDAVRSSPAFEALKTRLVSNAVSKPQ